MLEPPGDEFDQAIDTNARIQILNYLFTTESGLLAQRASLLMGYYQRIPLHAPTSHEFNLDLREQDCHRCYRSSVFVHGGFNVISFFMFFAHAAAALCFPYGIVGAECHC